jgi:hypothetical protein
MKSSMTFGEAVLAVYNAQQTKVSPEQAVALLIAKGVIRFRKFRRAYLAA